LQDLIIQLGYYHPFRIVNIEQLIYSTIIIHLNANESSFSQYKIQIIITMETIKNLILFIDYQSIFFFFKINNKNSLKL
jgi:hypothetical protein